MESERFDSGHQTRESRRELPCECRSSYQNKGMKSRLQNTQGSDFPVCSGCRYSPSLQNKHASSPLVVWVTRKLKLASVRQGREGVRAAEKGLTTGLEARRRSRTLECLELPLYLYSELIPLKTLPPPPHLPLFLSLEGDVIPIWIFWSDATAAHIAVTVTICTVT